MSPDVPGRFGGRHGQASTARASLPDPGVSCLADGNLAAGCESVLPDPWVSCLADGIIPGAGGRGNRAAVAAVAMHTAEEPARVHGWNATCCSLGSGRASGSRLT